MPTPNHLLLATGATAAVSVAVATALALYENPELRRYADDVRRRIAIALHSVGDGINPPHREPLFNRPEDAHGFMQSSANPGVDADEETRRRQREELLYWNSVRLQKEQEKEKQAMDEERSASGSSVKNEKSGTFDDFLHQDAGAEKGAYVFNSGAQVKAEDDGLRHRGFAASSYTNPFADEHHIGNDDMHEVTSNTLSPAAVAAVEDAISDIYSATDIDRSVDRLQAMPEPSEPSLIDADEHTPPASVSVSSVTADFETAASENEYEYMTAGQDDRNDVHASIQAWAHQQHSNPEFYEPLPSTPAVPQSEPELVSDGQLTPTDSMSTVGSDEAHSTAGRPFDVMSDSDGMNTPADWSEVGSVVSESDAPVPARAS